MKIKTFVAILISLLGFSASLYAKGGELMLSKENLFDSDTILERRPNCEELFYVDSGKDVPDMRDFRNYFCEGMYTLTLKGPPGTTVTLFGKFFFKKESGYLILKKKDDQMIWLLDLEAFPHDRWVSNEATNKSGAYEVFYHPAPKFGQRISSVKWGKWWPADPPPVN